MAPLVAGERKIQSERVQNFKQSTPEMQGCVISQRSKQSSINHLRLTIIGQPLQKLNHAYAPISPRIVFIQSARYVPDYPR